MAVAIDIDLTKAVKEEALAEVEYYQALSDLAKTESEKVESTKWTLQAEALGKIRSKVKNFFTKQNQRLLIEVTPLEIVLNPQILGEYNLDIKY